MQSRVERGGGVTRGECHDPSRATEQVPDSSASLVLGRRSIPDKAKLVVGSVDCGANNSGLICLQDRSVNTRIVGWRRRLALYATAGYCRNEQTE